MEKVIRSRGLRIFLQEGKYSVQEKIYYEPDRNCQVNNIAINELMNDGIISLFEYSMVNKKIDTYNFHVNLTNENYIKLYENLPREVMGEFNKIRQNFGESFRNYTVGYRLNETGVINRCYYFYPTIWKEDRYGIKGVTNHEKIIYNLVGFSDKIIKGDEKIRKEIYEFASILYKFKGVSIHVSEQINGYKLYGRVKAEQLKKYISEKSGYDISKNSQYGDAVLVALRIKENAVAGYNIYYLS